VISLHIKTAERAHMPSKQWEVIPLNRNYAQALEQIDEHLQYWPKFLIHKNKQRLTKITQYLIRMRKLKKKAKDRPIRVRYHKKVEKRLNSREDRALQVAKLDFKIKEELLERLKKGTYGEIYNFDQSAFDQVLENTEIEVEELDDEYIADMEDYDEHFKGGYAQSEDDEGDQNDDGMDTDNDTDQNVPQGDFFKPGDLNDLDSFFKSIPDESIMKKPKDRPRRSGKRHIEIEVEEDYETN